MPDDAAPRDLAHGVPPVAVSSTTTLGNRTGSWKYIRPVYQDRIAPCNAACPVGIDIGGSLNLLRQGKLTEARDLLRRENPMPAVTGRICDHPCQAACHRGSFDEAVGIRSVERMLGDLDPGPPPAPPARPERWKVAVVGAGPAGLACAYHLARLGHAVELFEADAAPGGSLRTDVPEYRLPPAVLAREIERVLAQGVTLRCGVRVGEDLPWRELSAYDAVFVGTGAPAQPPRGAGGADAVDVRPARQFLREVKAEGGGGIGRRVAVLGGTASGVDCARTARRLGAEAVVVCPQTREEVTAAVETVEEALCEGVRFEFQARPLALRTTDDPAEGANAEALPGAFEQGDGYGAQPRLVGVECERGGTGGAPGNGEAPAESAGRARFVLPADTLVLALDDGAGLGGLPDEVPGPEARIVVDEFGQTGRGAFFAGGAVAGETPTIAHALGSGKRAAIGIDRWLRARAGADVTPDDPRALRYGGTGNFSITRWRGDDPVFRTNEVNEVVPFDMLNPAHFPRVPAHADRLLPAAGRCSGFGETNLGLTAEDALAEARRCLNCGVCNMCELCQIFCPDVAIKRHASGLGFSLSYKYCKGCGVCVAECPRGAMTMTREGL